MESSEIDQGSGWTRPGVGVGCHRLEAKTCGAFAGERREECTTEEGRTELTSGEERWSKESPGKMNKKTVSGQLFLPSFILVCLLSAPHPPPLLSFWCATPPHEGTGHTGLLLISFPATLLISRRAGWQSFAKERPSRWLSSFFLFGLIL